MTSRHLAFVRNAFLREKDAERRANGAEEFSSVRLDAVRLDASADAYAHTPNTVDDGISVELRREPFEFGALPASRVAPTADTPAALAPTQRRLLAAAVPVGGRPAVAAEDLARCLDLSRDAASVVIATLRATLPEEAPPGGEIVEDADRRSDAGEIVFVQDLMLFLFAQTFARPRAQSQLRESGGVLETGAELLGGEGEDGGESADSERAFAFGSPARSPARRRARSPSPRKSGGGIHGTESEDEKTEGRSLTRPSLHALFAAHHFNAACGLVVEDPAKIGTGGAGGGLVELTAAEADRLEYLFRVVVPPREEEPPRLSESDGTGTLPDMPRPDFGAELERSEESSISRRCGLFAGGDRATVPAAALREWLVSRLAGARHFGKSKSAPHRLPGALSSPGRAASPGAAPGGSPASPGTNPGTLSSYLPCSASRASAVIENVRRGTAVRRRRDFPASASVRVADCEDAVVYLLAPAAYVSVVGCANCVVVVGAASRAVRVERCRRVTVIAAARRLRVRAAAECVFHLGVAERPVFLGECRGNVLAPYNTFYETLEADLETAGLSVDALSVDAWREPQCAFANLSDESRDDASLRDSDSSPSRGDASPRPGGGPASACRAVERMSPEAFAPFIVPFRGDTLNDSITKTTRANPFAVPDAYVAALDAKVRAVASLRGALRDARLGEEKKRDLQATIQAHFKEWLLESGSMRQVYELARIERGESAL